MNSPNEPEAMEDSSHTCTWTQSKLGDVAHYVNDKIIGREISIEQYVSTENMLVDKGGIVKAAIVPEESKITKYCAGDILISNIRPYFKKIWLAKHDGGCSTDVLVIRTKKGMDANFLYYSLTQDKFFDYVVAGSKGTKMPRGDKNAILEFSVPKPHLQEQEEIGKILSALDSKIELNQQMNKTLESIAQTLFKHWFIDFEFPDENGQPYKSSGGEMVDSEIGLIPKRWKPKRLSDFIDLEKGLSYKGKYLDDVGVPMVNLGCISKESTFIVSGIKHYSGEFKTRHQVLPGDIVIANTDITQNREVLGTPVFVPEFFEKPAFIFTHHLFAVRFKVDISKYFVFHLLRTNDYRSRTAGYATGTTVLAIPKETVLNLVIAEPDSATLSLFDSLIGKFRNRVNVAEKEIGVLGKVKALLLPKLMSGKIRVPLEDTNV